MRKLWIVLYLSVVLVSPLLVVGCGGSAMNQESARDEAAREAKEMQQDAAPEDIEPGDEPGE